MRRTRAAPPRGTHILGILDAAGSLAKEMFGDERQEDMQQFNSAEAAATRNFNAQEAQRQRAWEEHMSNTAIGRRVGDLQSAGLNPLLAFGGPGPASHHGVSPAHGPAASSGTASPGANPNIAASMASAAQVEVNEALADKVRAEADEIRERTKNYEPTRREIEARIPTHAAQVDNLKQQVSESAVRIEKLWEETRVATATASNVQQQTTNLREMVSQIRAQVQNLQALSAQSSAATAEIKQRVQANLPDLQSILHRLEASARRMQQPAQARDAAAADSLIGQIGAYLRAINPIRGLLHEAK